MHKALSILAVALAGHFVSGQAMASDKPLSVETNPHFVKTEMFGRVLVGTDDLALYTFKKDQKLGGYPPKCTTRKDDLPVGSCLRRWPAATISYEKFGQLRKSNPDLPYGVVFNVEVDSLQLTYEGLPLYYWFGDNVKEGTNFSGLGVNEAWDIKSLDKVVTYDGKVENK